MMCNHIATFDDSGEVYCRKLNKIVSFLRGSKQWRICNNCKMFAGSAQGEGVECVWDDPTEKARFVYCGTAKEEFARYRNVR